MWELNLLVKLNGIFSAIYFIFLLNVGGGEFYSVGIIPLLFLVIYHAVISIYLWIKKDKRRREDNYNNYEKSGLFFILSLLPIIFLVVLF